NFESTLSPWQVKADSQVTSYGMSRESPINRCPTDGTWHADLSINSSPGGRYGIWMFTSYSDSGSLSVTLDWYARGIQGCIQSTDPCVTMAYVGTVEPQQSSDFTLVSSIPINGDWINSHYATLLTGSSTIWVAMGWRHPFADPDKAIAGE